MRMLPGVGSLVQASSRSHPIRSLTVCDLIFLFRRRFHFLRLHDHHHPNHTLPDYKPFCSLPPHAARTSCSKASTPAPTASSPSLSLEQASAPSAVVRNDTVDSTVRSGLNAEACEIAKASVTSMARKRSPSYSQSQNHCHSKDHRTKHRLTTDRTGLSNILFLLTDRSRLYAASHSCSRSYSSNSRDDDKVPGTLHNVSPPGELEQSPNTSIERGEAKENDMTYGEIKDSGEKSERKARKLNDNRIKNDSAMGKSSPSPSLSSPSSSSSSSSSDSESDKDEAKMSKKTNVRSDQENNGPPRPAKEGNGQSPPPLLHPQQKQQPTLTEAGTKEAESSDDEIKDHDPVLSVLREPKKVRFGVAKVILTIVAGIYAGAFLAKFGANLLEEYEIFVKEDDDDD